MCLRQKQSPPSRISDSTDCQRSSFFSLPISPQPSLPTGREGANSPIWSRLQTKIARGLDSVGHVCAWPGLLHLLPMLVRPVALCMQLARRTLTSHCAALVLRRGQMGIGPPFARRGERGGGRVGQKNEMEYGRSVESESLEEGSGAWQRTTTDQQVTLHPTLCA